MRFLILALCAGLLGCGPGQTGSEYEPRVLVGSSPQSLEAEADADPATPGFVLHWSNPQGFCVRTANHDDTVIAQWCSGNAPELAWTAAGEIVFEGGTCLSYMERVVNPDGSVSLVDPPVPSAMRHLPCDGGWDQVWSFDGGELINDYQGSADADQVCLYEHHVATGFSFLRPEYATAEEGCDGYATYAMGAQPPSWGPFPKQCSVDLQIDAEWPGGFQATLSIEHFSPPVESWTRRWLFDDPDVEITNLWNGVHTQSGRRVQVDNASWNGPLGYPETFEVGFVADGTPPAFDEFYLNHLDCLGGDSDFGGQPGLALLHDDGGCLGEGPALADCGDALLWRWRDGQLQPGWRQCLGYYPRETNLEGEVTGVTPILDGAGSPALVDTCDEGLDQQWERTADGVVYSVAPDAASFEYACLAGEDVVFVDDRADCPDRWSQGGAAAAPGPDCLASYTLVNEWPGGFQASVQFQWNGPPVTGWDASWSFVNGETINSLWNADWTQNGADVALSNLPWNGDLDTGDVVDVGLVAFGDPAAVSELSFLGQVCGPL